MNFFSGGIIGFFFGFFFGFGCALAVIYSIYLGGYRKAIEDSLREEKSDRYRHWLPKIQAKLEKERFKA
jgi:hypothetical protein